MTQAPTVFTIEKFQGTESEKQACLALADSWAPATLSQDLECELVLVAKTPDDKIVGFLIAKHGYLETELHYIVAGVKRCGMAALMLQTLIDQIKILSHERLVLEVSSNNIPAARLYSKFGFKPIGVRKKYYRNGDDAIVMEINLV